MTCAECLSFLAARENLDPETFPAAVREHLGGCRRCASRLSAVRLLDGGAGLRAEPAAELARSITRALAERQPKGKPARWIPLAAAAVVALAVTVPFVGRLLGAQGTRAEVVTVHLTLVAPAAHEVDVVGDWNDWKPKAQPMKRQDGRWDIDVELQRGRCYQYQFLIDGDTWIPDPNGLARVDNGFGGVNSLLGS